MAPTWADAANLRGLGDAEVDLASQTPQSQPLNERQVANNAGGFTYKVDDLCRLRRFLVLGSEGGSYYVNAKALTLDNMLAVRRLLEAGQGLTVVKDIVAVSTQGRAPKQGPGLIALALACRLGDEETKKAAFEALPRVARTASTLFEFVEFCKAINQALADDAAAPAASKKGVSQNARWGRAMRSAVADWYLLKSPMQAAFQVTKYVQRSGWSNRDLLRLAHPKPQSLFRKRKQAETAHIVDGLDLSQATIDSANSEAWTLVDTIASPTAAAATAAAADPHEEQRQLERQVADMQLLFKFVTSNQLQPPAADAEGELADYLRAVWRLRKGNMLAPVAEERQEGESCGEATSEKKRVREAEAHVSDAGQKGSKKQRKADLGVKAPVLTLEEACSLIKQHRLGWEHVGDTRLLKQPALWATILDNGMPFTALLRNLGRLSALGLFNGPDGARHTEAVARRFRSEAAVRKSRVHPLTMLEAQRVYASRHGDKGRLTWVRNEDVEAALEAAFYLAFKNEAPTGKRFLAAVDVSGSMDCCQTAMKHLSSRECATAMLMSLVRTEADVTTLAFSNELLPLEVTRETSLKDALLISKSVAMGSTDCALPMLHALRKRLQVDVFVVYTDNETWCGDVHPATALQMYRRASGINAQLIVMAMEPTSFSIADPDDRGMLDVAGVDSGVPEIVRQFVLGEL